MTATLGDHATCAAAGDDDGGGDRSDDTFNGRCVAEVRDGHLLIRWDGPSGYCWKLLLRHLNLTPSEHATYGFSLARPECKSPIVSVLVSWTLHCVTVSIFLTEIIVRVYAHALVQSKRLNINSIATRYRPHRRKPIPINRQQRYSNIRTFS